MFQSVESPLGMARVKTFGFLRKLKWSLASFYPDPRIRELARLHRIPRYQPIDTTIFGQPVRLVDSVTFIGGYREIFDGGIYGFKAKTDTPRIIDCGANIGLSVIYFKKLYPKSRLTAFEPDPTIFATLAYNVAQLGFTGIELEQKAVWINHSGVSFQVEGGFSGRIPMPGDESRLISVESVRLRDYLNEKVDFLKVDIEGVEAEVLHDCKDLLPNVEHLFVEYHSHVSQKQTLHEVLAIFADAGFRYHVTEAFTRQQPFLDKHDLLGMDLQLNIFGYRDS
jgi:FkbM family methyltransferase